LAAIQVTPNLLVLAFLNCASTTARDIEEALMLARQIKEESP
jgi:hypothetical protein